VEVNLLPNLFSLHTYGFVSGWGPHVRAQGTKEREPATEGAQEHGHERLNHPVTERTFGFSGLIMNKEFKSKCLFFLMVPYSWRATQPNK